MLRGARKRQQTSHCHERHLIKSDTRCWEEGRWKSCLVRFHSCFANTIINTAVCPLTTQADTEDRKRVGETGSQSTCVNTRHLVASPCQGLVCQDPPGSQPCSLWASGFPRFTSPHRGSGRGPRRARMQLCRECSRGRLCAVASGNTCEFKR